jgi:hypothetical protein
MRGAVLFCCLAVSALSGNAETAEALFANRILPALQRECQGCHGGTQALSRLDVRTRKSLLTGARGPALQPGQAASSLLIHVIEGHNGLQMRPGGESKRLEPELIDAFRAWVDAGAPCLNPRTPGSGNTNRKISGPSSRSLPSVRIAG